METQTKHATLMEATPHAEHRWLNRLVGNWSVEGEMATGHGEPVTKFEGTECVRPVGDLWILDETQGEFPGVSLGTVLITLGYDPEKGKVVGTVIGSMMTSLWQYEGQLDEATGILTLNTEGPSMTEEGKTAKYRDTIEFKNDDEWIMTSQVQDKSRSWQQIMSSTHRRTRELPSVAEAW
jgi:hypothetical protein